LIINSSKLNMAPKIENDPLEGSVEILENRLYYKAFPVDPKAPGSNIPNHTTLTVNRSTGPTSVNRRIHYFSIDTELVYWNFFLDFGPLNLGQLYRFCTKLNSKISDPRLCNRIICFYSRTVPNKRTNAIYLICAWRILYLNQTPEEACHEFIGAILPEQYKSESRQNSPRSVSDIRTSKTLADIPPFHDASPCQCTYNLNLLDTLRGLAKARMHNFFNFDNFPIDEYEHFEQVENGDLNWIVKGKILAFAGPQYRRQVTSEGCYTLTPKDFIPYFQKKKVGLVVRLNKKFYNENEFRNAGIEHFEQYYLDGSCPPMEILQKVLQAFESVPRDKGFAVHCKAGLGRTGTCIGAYIMKHYRFTAAEVIGWMRICRPGMVIGPQQHFVQDIEQRMWHEGDLQRMKVERGISFLPSIKSLSVHEHGTQDEGHDAVRGRAGQADALLSRRLHGNRDTREGIW